MKFVVSRASQGLDNKPPCQGAKMTPLTYLDYRTVKTLEEVRKSSTCRLWSKEWLASGRNHREDPEKGMVVRDVTSEAWVISLLATQLLNFIRKEGPIILEESKYLEVPFALTIYDTHY